MQVNLREGENIDKALKRLKYLVMQEGILEKVYQKRNFENSSEKKKRKQRALHKKLKQPVFFDWD